MIVGGKEFDNNPQGWRDAADHVEGLGPDFYNDAQEMRWEAARMERLHREARRLQLGVVLIGLCLLIANIVN